MSKTSIILNVLSVIALRGNDVISASSTSAFYLGFFKWFFFLGSNPIKLGKLSNPDKNMKI